jgi:hypothetical protein
MPEDLPMTSNRVLRPQEHESLLRSVLGPFFHQILGLRSLAVDQYISRSTRAFSDNTAADEMATTAPLNLWGIRLATDRPNIPPQRLKRLFYLDEDLEY